MAFSGLAFKVDTSYLSIFILHAMTMFIQLMQAFAMVCSPLMCVSLPFRHLRYHKRFSVSSFTAADSFTLEKNATHTRSTITHSRCGKLKKIHEMCLCVWRFDTLRRQRWTYENSDFFYTAPDVSRTCSSSASCTAFQIESCFFYLYLLLFFFSYSTIVLILCFSAESVVSFSLPMDDA